MYVLPPPAPVTTRPSNRGCYSFTFNFVCRETFLRDTTNDAQDSPMEGVDNC